MGSCVSLHKDPESALKLRLDFGSKTDKLVNPSPDKHNHPMVADAVIKPHWSPQPPALTDSRNFGTTISHSSSSSSVFYLVLNSNTPQPPKKK